MFSKGDSVTIVSDNGYSEYEEYVGMSGTVRQVADKTVTATTIYPASVAVTLSDGREVAVSQDQLEMARGDSDLFLPPDYSLS